jgi:WD40 repeat protein
VKIGDQNPEAYQQRLEAKLRPERIRATLGFAGLYQVIHELIKTADTTDRIEYVRSALAAMLWSSVVVNRLSWARARAASLGGGFPGGERGGRPRSSGYDAFISYSHALDGELARELQIGLQSFAKPWYRMRALRVFRDTTSLSANPGLWSSIETALASSKWLVLMASPEAARSKWVNREVAWWLEHKSPQRLLVVLTEGEFAWAEDAQDGEGASAALPPTLRGAFVEEPRWVDLRWLHDVDQVAQTNPRLRECAADIAAAVREVPKDELVGEHIRQHRHAMRLARGGVTALVVLLIAAIVGGVLAIIRGNQAVAAQHTAIARGMVAQAERIRDQDPRGALQLGVAAEQFDTGPQAHASLLQTLESTPHFRTISGHTNTVWGVAFAPDGRTLATTSADRTVRLWDLSNRDQPRQLGAPLTASTNAIWGVAFAPDGRTLATGSADRTVRLWDVSNRDQPRSLGPPLTGHTNEVNGVAFAPDGRTLATASDDQTVRLWDVSNRDQPGPLGPPLTGHTNTVWGVAFALDGRTVATVSDDRTVRLWDVSNRDQPGPLGPPLTGHTDRVTGVAFAPDGRTVATASDDRTVRLWDVSNRDQPGPLGPPLTGHTDRVTAVAFAPDGRTLATTSADRTVRLWDLTNRDQPRSLGRPLTGHTNEVWGVAFAPDGRALATASADRTVRLWDVSDWGQPRSLGPPLTGHTSEVNEVAFAPDGRTLATASADRTVRLWDLTNRDQPRSLGPPLTGHTSEVYGVAFAPDGRALATVSGDWTVRLWDLSNRDQLRQLGAPLTGHTGRVTGVAFAPDGRTLATVSGDQTVRLWDLPRLEAFRGDEVREACLRAGGPLDKSTWDQYAPGISYRDTCVDR